MTDNNLQCFVFRGNKLALLVPMLCFYKGYNTAESIPNALSFMGTN